MKNEMTILGTSAGPGVPSFFCDCCACQEARQNPDLIRTRSGALLRSGLQCALIDCSPDLRSQLVREQIARIDAIFLTHWHFDHFGGLGELEYYVKLDRKEPIPFYLPPSAVSRFSKAFPDILEIFAVTPWQFYQPCRFADFTLTPLPARHGIETAGFLIESGQRKLAYFPDTAGLDETPQKLLGNLDWFICDATFSHDNWFPDSHMSLPQTIALGNHLGAQETVLTHLAMHYSQPVTNRDLNNLIATEPQVRLATDGLTFEFEPISEGV